MCGGVQKERMEPENTCVLSGDGTILSLPSRKPYPHKPTYETSNAGAGIHSHGIEYFLVTMINLMSKEFQVLIFFCFLLTYIQMIKGIEGHGYRDELVIKAYPKTTAVLVPNHVWRAGEDSNKVEKHLFATHETAGTKDDIKILHSQVEDDPKQGVAGAVPIPPSDAGKEEVIAALVANVDAMIKADRKITALKQLQGHIWRTGFESNELEGEVFDDVPEALEKWHSLGTKFHSLGNILPNCEYA
ncbi:hypothetical protein CICLE_v10009308mg [Citrus x clementina]|uniref:Uncharacterized protein n=1 Tax=Citrus clementina TaxID=85681 RepID=V4ULC2_CITCL|nr:hypothetical protein CICLE_v10009308mg [Citrus x clementina]